MVGLVGIYVANVTLIDFWGYRYVGSTKVSGGVLAETYGWPLTYCTHVSSSPDIDTAEVVRWAAAEGFATESLDGVALAADLVFCGVVVLGTNRLLASLGSSRLRRGQLSAALLFRSIFWVGIAAALVLGIVPGDRSLLGAAEWLRMHWEKIVVLLGAVVAIDYVVFQLGSFALAMLRPAKSPAEPTTPTGESP
ncbi:hypothetical protein GCM10023155_47440 [Bremerella cremea]